MDPETPEQWQLVVDSCKALLVIDAARQYGLVKGGPTADVDRCRRMLDAGQALGFTPTPDAIERFLDGWQAHCKERAMHA